MIYRLHTERKSNLAGLVSQFFPSFTLYQGEGYWKGQAEPSTTIEITTPDDQAIKSLALAIKYANGQESVLIESVESKGELV